MFGKNLKYLWKVKVEFWQDLGMDKKEIFTILARSGEQTLQCLQILIGFWVIENLSYQIFIMLSIITGQKMDLLYIINIDHNICSFPMNGCIENVNSLMKACFQMIQ